jgi:hypothetical protein
MLKGDFRAIPDLYFNIELLFLTHRASPAVCISTALRPASYSACLSTVSASSSTRMCFTSLPMEGLQGSGR